MPVRPKNVSRRAAERHAEALDLGQPAREQRALRVVAVAEPVADPGGDRDHVLERAADLDARPRRPACRRGSAATKNALLHRLGPASSSRRRDDRGRDAAAHFLGVARADSTARGRPRASLEHLAHALARRLSGSRPFVAQTSSASAARCGLRRRRLRAARARAPPRPRALRLLERRFEVQDYLKRIGKRNARQILPVLPLGLRAVPGSRRRAPTGARRHSSSARWTASVVPHEPAPSTTAAHAARALMPATARADSSVPRRRS